MQSPINNIYPIGAKRLTFLAEVPHGTKLEDILQPGYWANVAKKLIAHRTHIEADWEDGTRLVILRVVGVGLNHAKVRVLQDFSFVDAPAKEQIPATGTASVSIEAPAKPEAPAAQATPTPTAPRNEKEDDFEIAYKTHHHKWSVIRKSDKSYVKDLFESQPEAAEWLKKYLAGEVTPEAKAA